MRPHSVWWLEAKAAEASTFHEEMRTEVRGQQGVHMLGHVCRGAWACSLGAGVQGEGHGQIASC